MICLLMMAAGVAATMVCFIRTRHTCFELALPGTNVCFLKRSFLPGEVDEFITQLRQAKGGTYGAPLS